MRTVAEHMLFSACCRRPTYLRTLALRREIVLRNPSKSSGADEKTPRNRRERRAPTRLPCAEGRRADDSQSQCDQGGLPKANRPGVALFGKYPLRLTLYRSIREVAKRLVSQPPQH